MSHLLAVTIGTASSSSCCGCRLLLRRRLLHRLPSTPPTPPPSSPPPQVATYSSTVRLPHPGRFHLLAQRLDPMGFAVLLMDPTHVWGSDVIHRWYAMLKILLAKQDISSQNYTQVFRGFMEFSRIPFVVSSTELPNRT
jgi:hypothetical protein